MKLIASDFKYRWRGRGDYTIRVVEGGSTLATAKVAQSKQRLVTTLTDRELEILDPFFLTMNSVE